MTDYTRGDDPIYNGFREGWRCPCDAKEEDIELNGIVEGIDLDRLEQLCQAEQDGRLIVLPCKVGDTVYVLPHYPAYWDEIEETKITGVTQFPDKKGVSNQIVTSCCLCYEWERDIGKTIFLTREEAEAALRRWEILEKATRVPREAFLFTRSKFGFTDFNYGKTWLAYRHKPKEEHHEAD